MENNTSFDDPNPVTNITFVEVLHTTKFICIDVPWIILSKTVQHLWPPSSAGRLSLTQDLTRSLFRSATHRLPLSLFNNFADRKGTQTLSSTRYKHLKDQIYQPVRTADFAGYWICRGLSSDHTGPETSDLVILFLHGGGYVAGHPSDNISDLLFISETLAKIKITMSIFSLDYTLAPRAGFPKQVEETTAAYEYLINSLGVDSSKIAIMGESAGAHLALSFLTDLQLRSVGDPAALPSKSSISLPKPAIAVLVSPWIDLLTRHPRARDLETRDFMGKTTLDAYSKLLLQTTPPRIQALYENFGQDVPERGLWQTILPAKTWVSAGGDELFVEDIKAFVKHVEQGGANVTFELTQGETHAWQSKIAVMDRRKFLAASQGGESIDGLMKGHASIAQAILAMLEVS
ncbi:MAG: hypothetical protein M1834_002349 [Cirrosporium novae-zelandiae]|nr:MAG: hypothetical protein M1834_002349 [Cirrosporium novae-zelandiae]